MMFLPYLWKIPDRCDTTFIDDANHDEAGDALSARRPRAVMPAPPMAMAHCPAARGLPYGINHFHHQQFNHVPNLYAGHFCSATTAASFILSVARGVFQVKPYPLRGR